MGIEEVEEIWVKHYSSNQRILLVGEGDFSFSSSLALRFGSATNIVATSLDTYDILVGKYKKAKWNLQNLLKLGGCTLHGVDATKMGLHLDLKMQKFDRIIFNFPHAGFHGKENDIRLIGRHKKLVLGFFTNASGMLRANGEIHVTHKTSFPFNRWNIKELAWRNSLRLVECVDFKIQDYPGYNNKRGDKKRCDEPFPLGECSTFKFGFFPAIKKNNTRLRSELSNGYLFETTYQPTAFHQGHLVTCLSRYMNDVVLPKPVPVGNAYLFGRQLNQTSEFYHTSVGSDLHYFDHGTLRFDYERSMAEAFGRSQLSQANPTEYNYQCDPFGPSDVQRGYEINMNDFPGYIGAPLSITIHDSGRCFSHLLREACRQNVSIYGQYSGGTCKHERSVESGSGTLHELNVLYQETNAANAGVAFGFPAI